VCVAGFGGEFVKERVDIGNREWTLVIVFILFELLSFRERSRIILTEHVLCSTSFNSCPRQPVASSRLHFSKVWTSSPKQFASRRVMRVSWMSYLRSTSSSGNKRWKQTRVVLGGRGENRLRSSSTHLWKMRRAG